MLYVNDACNLREDSIFMVSLDVSFEIVFVHVAVVLLANSISKHLDLVKSFTFFIFQIVCVTSSCFLDFTFYFLLSFVFGSLKYTWVSFKLHM